MLNISFGIYLKKWTNLAFISNCKKQRQINNIGNATKEYSHNFFSVKLTATDVTGMTVFTSASTVNFTSDAYGVTAKYIVDLEAAHCSGYHRR